MPSPDIGHRTPDPFFFLFLMSFSPFTNHKPYSPPSCPASPEAENSICQFQKLLQQKHHSRARIQHRSSVTRLLLFTSSSCPAFLEAGDSIYQSLILLQEKQHSREVGSSVFRLRTSVCLFTHFSITALTHPTSKPPTSRSQSSPPAPPLSPATTCKAARSSRSRSICPDNDPSNILDSRSSAHRRRDGLAYLKG